MAAVGALKVITTKPTLLDYQAVERGISERIGLDVERSQAFARYVLEKTFLIDPLKVDDFIVDGGNDRGIDIAYIDEENRIINLGSCKTVGTYKKSLSTFPGSEIDKIISFVDDLIYRREVLLTSLNPALVIFVRRAWELLGSEDYTIQVHLFSNQLTLAKSESTRLVTHLGRHGIKLFEHGLYELAHGIVRAAKPRFKKAISTIKGCCYAINDNGMRGFTATLTLSELKKFLSVGRPSLFDERLLAENVRYYLGISNDVNREIRETLLSGHSSEFWYLNNGITIVCDQIVGMSNGCHPITVVNPQIVNGGQTANVVFEILSESLLRDADGSIAIKIIETSDEDFIKKIAVASNTQSRILSRDLRANDRVQTKLASALSDRGYSYIRKRGATSASLDHNEIDAARVGQLLLAYLHAEPARSKTDSQEIFGDLYSLVFNENDLDADLIVAIVHCHDKIEEKRKKAEALQRAMANKSFDETWIIEGHLHVIYAVGEILRRRGLPLNNRESCLDILDEAITIVEEFVRQNPKISYYRLFRSSSTKDSICNLINAASPSSPHNPVQMTLFPD